VAADWEPGSCVGSGRRQEGREAETILDEIGTDAETVERK
jgi:hypothetical protein